MTRCSLFRLQRNYNYCERRRYISEIKGIFLRPRARGPTLKTRFPFIICVECNHLPARYSLFRASHIFPRPIVKQTVPRFFYLPNFHDTSTSTQLISRPFFSFPFWTFVNPTAILLKPRLYANPFDQPKLQRESHPSAPKFCEFPSVAGRINLLTIFPRNQPLR